MAGAAESIGCPQTITNCSALPPFMGGRGGERRRGSSSHSHDSMEDKLELSSFSLDDISNHYNPSDYGSAAASMGIDLQQYLGFDLKHEYDTHLLPEMLHDPNPTPPLSPMDQPNWDATGVQEMQDMNYNPLQLQRPQQMCLQQNLQTFDTTSFANPDLLNLLHLPRCSVSSVLPTPTVSFSSKKLSNYPASPDIFCELPTTADINNPVSSSTLFDHPPLRFQNFQFEKSVLDFRRDIAGLCKGGDGRGTHHFATERQRREQFNEKYKALGALIPNPRKRDKASVVGDAIEYIKELLRTVQELELLVDKKKCMQKRNKRLKVEDETAVDMESSSMKTRSALTDLEQSFNGSLRSSWSQRRSKETEVDVRIIDDEVTIKLTQRKKTDCLLLVSKVLDELQLELLHVAGGKIGDCYRFLFNTKIYEGSSVYASAMAKKLVEVVDG